jgi:molecular chaperone HtpG
MFKQVEVIKFQAKINHLMILIIKAFNTNKEIFLRKRISNWSDARDKIRYESIKNAKVSGEQKEFKIDILSDKENKCISVIKMQKF